MQKDLTEVKISLKMLGGGLLFLKHPVVNSDEAMLLVIHDLPPPTKLGSYVIGSVYVLCV